MNPFIPFFLGFIIATILSVVIMMITEEVRKKRAIAFTKRFSLISEGLSSLKALAFRVTGQLKKIRPQCQPQNITKENIEQISSYIDSMIYIFDIISGLVKSIVFAAAIAAIGCQRGFKVRGGAEAVGNATTSSVVSAIFLIIVIDSTFAIILHYIR